MKSINQIFTNNKQLMDEPEVQELIEYCRELEEETINSKFDKTYSFEDKLAEVKYDRIQNVDVSKLTKFVRSCTKASANMLRDMYDYELKGYNNLSRARIEVLDLIRGKLNELGGGMSPITVND